MNVAILGIGFVGTRLAELLSAAGHDVYGVRRGDVSQRSDVSQGSESSALNYSTFRADITREDDLLALPQHVTHIVFAAAPGASARVGQTGRRGDKATSESTSSIYQELYVGGCRNLVKWSAHLKQLERVVFISSTSVYGDAQGGWVTEDTPALPASWNGQHLLEAEKELSRLPCSHVSLRCAGIYGPGRTRLIDSVRNGTAGFDPNAPQYMNRIHRDDVAGAVKHLLSIDDAQPVYIGVDDDPAPDSTVLPWLAEQLGAQSVAQRPAASGTPGNKRCSNALLRDSGYSFTFPSFRDGYGAMLSQN